MDGFVLLWLLFNTKTGKCILGFLVVSALVYTLGWWTIAVVIVLIAIMAGFYQDEHRIEKREKREREEL